MANALNLFCQGAVGFIDLLDQHLPCRNVLSGHYDALACLPLAVNALNWMALLNYMRWPKANVDVIMIRNMNAVRWQARAVQLNNVFLNDVHDVKNVSLRYARPIALDSGVLRRRRNLFSARRHSDTHDPRRKGYAHEV